MLSARQTGALFKSAEHYSPAQLRQAIRKEDLPLCTKIFASGFHVDTYLEIEAVGVTSKQVTPLQLVLSVLKQSLVNPDKLTAERLDFFNSLIQIIRAQSPDLEKQAMDMNMISEVAILRDETPRRLAKQLLSAIRVLSEKDQEVLRNNLTDIVRAPAKCAAHIHICDLRGN